MIAVPLERTVFDSIHLIESDHPLLLIQNYTDDSCALSVQVIQEVLLENWQKLCKSILCFKFFICVLIFFVAVKRLLSAARKMARRNTSTVQRGNVLASNVVQYTGT